MLFGRRSLVTFVLGLSFTGAVADTGSSDHHSKSTKQPHSTARNPTHQDPPHQQTTGNQQPDHPLESGVISILRHHTSIGSDAEHDVKTYLQHKSADRTLISGIESLIEHQTHLPPLISAISSLFEPGSHTKMNQPSHTDGHTHTQTRTGSKKNTRTGRKSKTDTQTSTTKHIGTGENTKTRKHTSSGKHTGTESHTGTERSDKTTYVTNLPVTLTVTDAGREPVTKTETYKVHVTDPAGHSAIFEHVEIPLTNSRGSTYSTLRTKLRVQPDSSKQRTSTGRDDHKTDVNLPVVVTTKNSQGERVTKTETYKVQVTDPAGHKPVKEHVIIRLTNEKGSVYSTMKTDLRIGPSGTLVRDGHSSHHSSNTGKNQETEVVQLPVVLTTRNGEGKKVTKTETYKIQVTDPPKGHTAVKEHVTVHLTNSEGSVVSKLETNVMIGPGGSLISNHHSSSRSRSKKGGSSTRHSSSGSKKASSGTKQASSSTKRKTHRTKTHKSTAGAGPKPTIVTSTEVHNGHTELVPILKGGSITQPVTLGTNHATITANGPALSTHVSQASHDMVALLPLLMAWSKNPTPAQATSISHEVEGVIAGLGGLLASIPSGGGGGGGSCGGLFGAIGCALQTATNGLATISSNLLKGRVSAVMTAFNAVKAAADELQQDEKEHNSKTDDTSTKGSSTERSSSTSSESSCTKTSTIHSLDVSCTVVTITKNAQGAKPTTSKTCKTSTHTVRGCDISSQKGHTTTTTEDACPSGARKSALEMISRAAAAAVTTISGTPVPLWFWDGGKGGSLPPTGSETSTKRRSTGTHSHPSSTKTGKGPTKTKGPSSTHKPSDTTHTTKHPKPTKPPTSTGKNGFVYTSTDEENGNIYGCTDTRVSNYAGYDVTFCHGSSTKIGHTSPLYPMPPSSVLSAEASSWSSLAAKPSGSCLQLSDNGDGGEYLIYGINGWGGPKLVDLAQQESGCGFFEFDMHYGYDGFAKFHGRFRDTSYAFVYLDGIKGGCVERAVDSAGGPSPGDGEFEIQCHWPDEVDKADLPLFQNRHPWTKQTEEPYNGYMFNPNPS